MTFDPTRAIYGDQKTISFFRDAKNGTDCLDVVLIGDSNTGFGQYGWHEGLAKAFIAGQGTQMYATQLAPFVGPINYSAGVIGYFANYDVAPIRSSTASPDPARAYTVGQTSGVTYGVMHDGFVYANTDANCATLRNKFNVGICSGDDRDINDFLSNNGLWGFGFSDSGGSVNDYYYSHVHGGVTIRSGSPFLGATFTYRVVHSQGLSGGTFSMNIRTDVPAYSDIVPHKTINTNNSSVWGWTASELSTTSIPSTTQIRCSSFGLLTDPPSRTVIGNVGFLFHSCYRKVKGVAFNNLMYMGGRNSTKLLDTLSKTPDATLVTYVTELYNRQRAAGGSGRLVFFIQSGTNDVGDTPQQLAAELFLSNFKAMIAKLQRVLIQAGISRDKFAFMVMVSHPMTANDEDDVNPPNSLTPYREALAEGDVPATFVNLLALGGTYATTYDRLFSQNLYASPTDFNHLLPGGSLGQTGGYDELGGAIAQAIINYIPPAPTIVGPIVPKYNQTEGALPYVSQSPISHTSPAVQGEIITNWKDGRLWLRKMYDTNGLYKYNYEQIGGPHVIIEKTGGHTLVSEDSARILEMNVSNETQITIPSYTGSDGVNFVKGTEVKIILTNTGPVTITGASGVTLNSKNGFTLSSQWGTASLIKRDTNSWVITGDLS